MLISTKLQHPALRPPMLFRKNLVQRLAEAEGFPLLVISGPAGSGKTSLICQCPMEKHTRTAWYSLDQEDNEPDLFYRYILKSLINAEEGLKTNLGPMLGSRQQLHGDAVIPLIIESLSGSKQTFRIILDDFHHINNKKILDELTRLIRYVPDRLQLVVLSRHPLPESIGSVAYKKEFLEISAKDLRFTETETKELFNTVFPLSISSGQIRELNQRLEGWAAGLQLFGLKLGSNNNSVDFSNILNQAHDQIAGFLVHDILKDQPENIRKFVYATALLTRFNSEVCAEITGEKDASRTLSTLERMNLFLIPLDGNGKWYRYHHMFSEAVRRQIQIDDPGMIKATLQKAATWFAENGHTEDAVRCAFRADDFDLAADLLEDHIFEYIMNVNPMTGLRWISRLPSSVLNPRIYLRLQQCLILMMLMEFSKVREVLSSVESISSQSLSRYPEDKQRLCEDYIILLHCLLNMISTDRTADIPNLLAMGEKISPENRFLFSGVELNAVFAYCSLGDLTSAEAYLTSFSKGTAVNDIIVSKIYIDKARAIIARHRGRLHEAEAIINQIQQDIGSQGMNDRPEAFFLHRHLGHIYYLQNKLDKAQECFDRAIRYCEDSGLFEDIATGNEAQQMLYLAQGHKEKIMKYQKRLHTYSTKFGVPQFSDGMETIRARLSMEQGNLAPALLWAKQRKLKADDPFSLLFVMQVLIQTRIFLMQKKNQNAIDLLEPVRKRCQKRGLLDLVLSIDILRSANYHALKRHDKARAILLDALSFSEAEGYVRPFVESAIYIEPVLKEIASNQKATSFSTHLEHVLSGCRIKIYNPSIQNEDDIIVEEDLSKREIEILEWMAHGFQNKEIAQKTSISINTVKSHVRKILAKLNVRTRTQAVVKAKEMNVI